MKIVTAQEVKDLMCQLVYDSLGMKATELVTKLAISLSESKSTINEDIDVIALLKEIVDSRELVEVEYVLPNMEHRIKSFLLPKGSSVALD